MTDTQLYFAIGIPCLTILASLIVSAVSFWGVRESMKDLRDDMKALRTDLHDDVKGLRAEVNTKLDMLLAKFYEHDGDIARLKDKTGLS